MKKVNLNNRNEFYASDSLLEMAVSKKSKCYINLAYTDYGGTFLDKTLISYFEEYFQESIISENTSWYGKNAFIFGKMAIELEGCLDNILSFRSFENYYSDSEFNGWLGYGVHCNYDRSIEIDYDLDVVGLRMDDGRMAVFRPLEVDDEIYLREEKISIKRFQNYFIVDESNWDFA